MTKRRSFLLVALGMISVAAIAAEDGVFYDPVTGDYLVRFTIPANEEGPAYQDEGIFYPSTKISPLVASSVEALDGGGFQYQYSVSSSGGSKQPLITFATPCNGFIDASNPSAVVGWHTTVLLGNSIPQTRSIRWGWRDMTQNPTVTPTKGLQPNQQQRGFAIFSGSLPGISNSCLDGNAQMETFTHQAEEPGSALRQQIEELRKKDFVTRFAAIPTISIPQPFNAVPVLEQIRSHATPWPQKGLMGQSLWVLADGYLAAAITALKKGDVYSAESSLTQLRVELRRKYPDLDVTTVHDDPTPADIPTDAPGYEAFLRTHDQRMAAKVLDFDAAFVLYQLILGAPSNLDAPAPLMPPLTNTMYAPPADLDGSFTVSWSTPLLVTWPGSATREAVAYYDVEFSRNGDFAASTKVRVDRQTLSHRLHGLVPGRIHVRVVAWIGRTDRCQGCIGGQEPLEAYPPFRSVTYNGPGRTEVLAAP